MKYNGVNIQKINNNSKNYTINNKQAYHWCYRTGFCFKSRFTSTFYYYCFFLTHTPHYYLFSRFAELSYLALRFGITLFPFSVHHQGHCYLFLSLCFLSPSPLYFFTKLATPWTWLSVMVCTLYSFSNLSFCASSLKWLSFEQNERKVVFIIQFLFTICHFHLFIFQSHS